MGRRRRALGPGSRRRILLHRVFVWVVWGDPARQATGGHCVIARVHAFVPTWRSIFSGDSCHEGKLAIPERPQPSDGPSSNGSWHKVVALRRFARASPHGQSGHAQEHLVIAMAMYVETRSMPQHLPIQ
jgi:hypothetical protein